MELRIISMLWALLVAEAAQDVCKSKDPAADQLQIFKSKHPVPVGIMTSTAGAPINYNETYSLNKSPLRNVLLMESLSHMVNERRPERTNHAKGTGAFGYLQITNDVTHICKAKFLSEVGKKTPLAVRFSLSTSSYGTADTVRDIRGFAVKFYTEDGNFDLLGFNTPVSFVRDAVHFKSFLHALKRNPVTNLNSADSLWDALTLRSESLLIFLHIFADMGIPDGYRHMPGYSVHTYQVSNEDRERFFIRFHFIPEAGMKYLNSTEAVALAGSDPDYAVRDLYNAIGSDNFPSWTCSVQVLSESDVKNASFDVFDSTRVLPLNIYPLVEIGKIVLNRNPTNHFADIEQLAFNPGNFVPGIQGAPDKMFEVRSLIYRQAHLYRLGSNYFNIPVNRPLNTVLTNIRDGVPLVDDKQKDWPNYYPNSFNGIEPYIENNMVDLLEIQENEASNFDQARDFYSNELSSDEKVRLINNLVSSLSSAKKELQERAIQIFSLIHEELSNRIQEGLIQGDELMSC